VSANYSELPGKVAVVTGAARGMGATFAEGLLAEGINVVGADRDFAAMSATAERINSQDVQGATLVPLEVDVTSQAEQNALADSAIKHFGRLDFWINNAGVFPQTGVLDITPEELELTFRVNVFAAVYGVQAAARVMGDHGGSIVNIGSVASLRVRSTWLSYSASKAALEHLTKFQALELGARAIRVNTIAPGYIDTDMTAWLHETPDALDKALEGIPMGRLGTPQDILDSVLFLLSDSSSYMSGTTHVVDGATRHKFV